MNHETLHNREPLLNSDYRAYFDRRMNSRINEVNEIEIGIASNPTQYSRLDRAYAQLFYLSVDLLQGQYSRGDALPALAAALPDLIRKWEQYLHHPAHEPFEFAAPITADVRYLDNYTDALRLLAWAYLFKVEEAVWLRLVTCIGNAGQDALLERLILRRLPWLAKERPAAAQLVYPKAYQSLYDALDAPAADQPKLVQAFLQNWYKNLKKVSWHDTHKQGSFFGYWAWEAAAVTLAFGLDDSAYKTADYYPADAVAFARASL